MSKPYKGGIGILTYEGCVLDREACVFVLDLHVLYHAGGDDHLPEAFVFEVYTLVEEELVFFF